MEGVENIPSKEERREVLERELSTLKDHLDMLMKIEEKFKQEIPNYGNYMIESRKLMHQQYQESELARTQASIAETKKQISSVESAIQELGN